MQNSPSNFGPVQQRPTGRNWLPFILGGGIALALICAVGFVIFAMFFFDPQQPVPPAEATATLPVANFVTVTPAGQQPPDVAAQPSTEPSPAAPQLTPAEQPPAEATTEAETSAPTPVPAPPSAGPASMSSPDFGIQAFLYWRAETAARDVQLINDIKFNWVKQEFPWREIEGGGKGQFDWANTDRMMEQIDAHNLKVIARISTQPEWAGGNYPELGPPDNYQDFVDFLVALATRYRGRIDAYQIWNEPNLAREWGDRPPNPAEYAELLRLSYQAIKAVDPNAWIITAGLAPTSRWDDVAMPDTVFVQGLYDAGAAPYFDALGVHGAGYKVPPQTKPGVVANDPVLNNNDPSPPKLKRIYAFRHIEDVHQVMVDNGDVDKRVVVLEFGWTVDPREDSPYYWHAVSELEQAQYIIGAYSYAEKNWQPWIGVMSLIYLANPDWTEADEQTYWSITYPLYPEFKARAAYWALLERANQQP